jgi:hypothetical protein
MKVLIISLPRTGSSKLLFSLAKEKNLKPVFEPFSNFKKKVIKNRWTKENDDIIRTYHQSDNNIIVKTIIFQHPDNLSLSKEFDEIILLSRKDLISCAESWVYFLKNRKNGFDAWMPYTFEGIDTEEIKSELNRLIEYDFTLKQISNTINIPITYYEDLYDLNNPDRLRKFNKII